MMLKYNHTVKVFFIGGLAVVCGALLFMYPQWRAFAQAQGYVDDRPGRPQIPYVPMDVKPMSCPNSLNVNSMGTLTVAILGNQFVDVNQIDPASIVLFGRDVRPQRSSLEDVATPFYGDKVDCLSCNELGPDGFLDLVLKFDIRDIADRLVADKNEDNRKEDGNCLSVNLSGRFKDGTGFFKGTDRSSFAL